MNPFHNIFKQYIPLAARDLSISFVSKNPNIPLNVCKCSTEKTCSARDIGTQTVRKCYSKSSTLLPNYNKKNSCRHRGLNPRRTFCAIIFHLLFQPYYPSDDRVRLKFCESTVNMPYANGQQSRVQLKIRRGPEVLKILY